MSYESIIRVSRLVPEGRWTNYGTIGVVVFGHPFGGQTVGRAIRAEACIDSAHRTLTAVGKVAEGWRGGADGPEDCIRRLRREGSWNDTTRRARPDRFVDAVTLQRLADAALPTEADPSELRSPW